MADSSNNSESEDDEVIPATRLSEDSDKPSKNPRDKKSHDKEKESEVKERDTEREWEKENEQERMRQKDRERDEWEKLKEADVDKVSHGSSPRTSTLKVKKPNL